MKLVEELKMKKPFARPEQEALVSIIATNARIEEIIASILAPFGITRPQFNMLRILRGAHPDGLTCTAINDRLVTKSPDITRLLDRLEEARLVERARGVEDRRQVYTIISKNGLAALAQVDEKIHAFEIDMMNQLSQKEISALIGSLERIRDTLRAMKSDAS